MSAQCLAPSMIAASPLVTGVSRRRSHAVSTWALSRSMPKLCIRSGRAGFVGHVSIENAKNWLILALI